MITVADTSREHRWNVGIGTRDYTILPNFGREFSGYHGWVRPPHFFMNSDQVDDQALVLEAGGSWPGELPDYSDTTARLSGYCSRSPPDVLCDCQNAQQRLSHGPGHPENVITATPPPESHRETAPEWSALS